jgi:glycosyltransferase involved in cell wall biosynthesis
LPLKRCSILVPAYNVERYVSQAVQSALSQTYGPVQVIVVNDGSSDGTAEALAPYMDEIVYVDQPNTGLAGTRNRALREATGDYVALLDADDLWMPTRLERMISYLEEHPDVGFVTSDAYFMQEEDPSTVRYYEYYDFLLQGDPFGVGDQRYWILFHNFVMGMTVVRRELFERHGNFEESLGTSEDWDLWIRFIHGGERAGLVHEPLCYYRLRSDSLSKDLHRIHNDSVRVIERAVIRLGPQGTQGFGRPLLRRGKQALALGDWNRAAVFYAAAGRDPALPVRKRAEALAFATLPALGWRVWVWKSRRAAARRG